MKKIYSTICYQSDDNAISGVIEAEATTTNLAPEPTGEELQESELTASQESEAEDAQQTFERTGEWPADIPKWIKERYDRFSRKNFGLKTQLEREKAENAELRKKLQEKSVVDVGKAPSRDDFDDEDSYIDARTEWNYKRLRAADSSTEKATAETVKQEHEAKTFNEKVETLVGAGSKKHSNFVEVVESVPAHIFNKEVVEAITASGIANKNSEDVAWFLANNLDEAERIAQLAPLERAASLGSLSAKLAAPKPTKTTQTPDPITPVRGKGSPSGEIPDDIDGLAAILKKHKGKY